MTDQIFSATNKLKDYSVKIGTIDLTKETIISIELSYKNYTPTILGRIVVNDLYDLSHTANWRDIKVQIYYMDIQGGYVKKEFIVLTAKEVYDNKKNKTFVIDLQDTFSYTLEHSYLTKGFSTNPTNALEQYLTKSALNLLDTYIKNFTAKLELSQVNSYSFIIPNRVNNLEWFISEFNKHGFTFYQDKQKIKIKSLTDLIPSKLPDNDKDLYLNETDNQLYKNRIIEFRGDLSKRKDILPKTRVLAFDPLTKKMVSYTNNDNSSLSLSTDKYNLQDTVGTRDVVQQHLNFDQHNSTMKNSFIKQSEMEIVINGFVKNDINQLYDLKLKGNSNSIKSQNDGNQVLSGKYISTIVIDKIIGDNFIQKVILQRADSTKRT